MRVQVFKCEGAFFLQTFLPNYESGCSRRHGPAAVRGSSDFRGMHQPMGFHSKPMLVSRFCGYIYMYLFSPDRGKYQRLEEVEVLLMQSLDFMDAVYSEWMLCQV